MKPTKRYFETVIMIIMAALFIAACQKENDVTPLTENPNIDKAKIDNLITLANIGKKTTEERFEQWRAGWSTLNFEELNYYNELDYTAELQRLKDNNSLSAEEKNQLISETNHNYNIRIKGNNLSVKTFNMPYNQLGRAQFKELVQLMEPKKIRTESNTANRTNACFVRAFPNYILPQYSYNGVPWTGNGLVTIQGQPDCDWEFWYYIPRRTWRWIVPWNTDDYSYWYYYGDSLASVHYPNWSHTVIGRNSGNAFYFFNRNRVGNRLHTTW